MLSSPRSACTPTRFNSEGRCALDEPQVSPTKNVERRQCFTRIGVCVMKPFGPEILVVTGDLRPVVREDQSHAPSPHQIGVSQMLQHLDDGPLVGSFRECAVEWA
jgi:hypothetical protein